MWLFLRRFLHNVQDQFEADHVGGDLADLPEQTLAQPEPVVVHDTEAPVHLQITPDGWIEPTIGSSIKVERIPTKRIQKLATPRGEPHMIVWHWTATPAGSVRNAAKRIQNLPDKAKGERAASFHLGIPQAGALIQLASVEVGTWHAGGASAARFMKLATDRTGLSGSTAEGAYVISPKGPLSANAISVGVELENVGEVRLVKGKWRSWPFKDGEGHVVKEEDTVSFRLPGEKSPRRYERFTEHQVHQATEFVRAMAIAYPRSITRASCSWAHFMIDPTRKTDPGPYWMEEILPKILDEVFP
jgi:N-acetyl-anhydromuramyl-L-alanine amidase AmpD